MTRDGLRRSSAHVFVGDLATCVLDDDDAHHLARVLRLRDGETVTCSDGAGSWRACLWSGDGLTVSGEIAHVPAPAPRLSVVLPPVKGDRTDDAVQKLVEVGVDRIVILAPVERSVVRWDAARAASQMQRLARVVRAASMQSRRVHLPLLEGPASLDDVLAGEGVALAEPDEAGTWDEVTTVVVGPEGGFSSVEAARASRRVSLGQSILRAETAAVVAGARLVAHWRG